MMFVNPCLTTISHQKPNQQTTDHNTRKNQPPVSIESRGGGQMKWTLRGSSLGLIITVAREAFHMQARPVRRTIDASHIRIT